MIISEPTQDAVGAEAFAQPAVIAVKSPAQSTRYRARRDVLGCAGQRTGMPEQNTREPAKSLAGRRSTTPRLTLPEVGSHPSTQLHTRYMVQSRDPLKCLSCVSYTVVPVHLEV